LSDSFDDILKNFLVRLSSLRPITGFLTKEFTFDNNSSMLKFFLNILKINSFSSAQKIL